MSTSGSFCSNPNCSLQYSRNPIASISEVQTLHSGVAPNRSLRAPLNWTPGRLSYMEPSETPRWDRNQPSSTLLSTKWLQTRLTWKLRSLLTWICKWKNVTSCFVTATNKNLITAVEAGISTIQLSNQTPLTNVVNAALFKTVQVTLFDSALEAMVRNPNWITSIYGRHRITGSQVDGDQFCIKWIWSGFSPLFNWLLGRGRAVLGFMNGCDRFSFIVLFLSCHGARSKPLPVDSLRMKLLKCFV